MKKFVCKVCGYIYEGDAAPAECPVCHAKSNMFEEVKGELTLAAEHEYGIYAKTVKNNPDISEADKKYIFDQLKANFNGECSEVGMYLCMARIAHREGYPEIGLYWEKAAYEEAEDIEEGSDDEIGGAVHEAATEHGAESGGSEGRAENLFPSGLRRGGPYRLQPLAGLGESVFPGGDLIAQLVDFHYLGELYSTYGDEFHVGVPTKRAGCEYAVAEHEEMAGIHPVMRGDPFHRVLHTGDFRSVLKEDVPGYRGDFQNLGRVFCLNHSAKIQ